ncbi:MAG TPA: cytochrome c [Dongiaceae bacterium]|nr:cytochrome c [Dongiaceae bacterium]
MKLRRSKWVAAALLLLALAGCDRMANQPKRKAYEPANGAESMHREPPTGTVAREDGPVTPPPVTLALLKRGQERFNIYCAPCHSPVGDGDGMIVRRGFPHPPSYVSDRLLSAPVQHYVDVITNGYGAMYPYAARVDPADRWAIAAYIRALQASQHAALADLSPEQRAKLP